MAYRVPSPDKMLFNVLAALATAGAVSANVVSRPGANFNFPSPAAEGYETISNAFNIDPSTERITGHYAATQLTFQSGDLCYYGLQPLTPGTRATNGHIAFSVFGKGTRSGDPDQCKDTADGGDGTSCWLDIDLDFGRWYSIEQTVVETDAEGSRRWNGTLVDDQGKRTHIASYWTPKAFGALAGHGTQWLEWWWYNDDEKTHRERTCQPKFDVAFTKPKSGDSETLYTSIGIGEIEDKCGENAGKPNTFVTVDDEGYMRMTAGFLNDEYDY